MRPFKNKQVKEAYIQVKEACIRVKEAYIQVKEAYIQVKEAYIQVKEAYIDGQKWPHVAPAMLQTGPGYMRQTRPG